MIVYSKKGGIHMATSSILDNVIIKDKTTADSFVCAIESSKTICQKEVVSDTFFSGHIATKDEINHLYHIRSKNLS